MKPTLILIVALTLSACSDSEETHENTTELSGSWTSICKSGDFFGDPYSGNTNITFKSNTVLHVSNIYTDSNCQVLTLSLEANHALVIGNEETLEHVQTFEIGNEVIADNGELVKEINYFTSENMLIKDIFLIQDDSSIYFGYPCNPIFCEKGDRPVLVNYSRPYFKDI